MRPCRSRTRPVLRSRSQTAWRILPRTRGSKTRCRPDPTNRGPRETRLTTRRAGEDIGGVAAVDLDFDVEWLRGVGLVEQGNLCGPATFPGEGILVEVSQRDGGNEEAHSGSGRFRWPLSSSPVRCFSRPRGSRVPCAPVPPRSCVFRPPRTPLRSEASTPPRRRSRRGMEVPAYPAGPRAWPRSRSVRECSRAPACRSTVGTRTPRQARRGRRPVPVSFPAARGRIALVWPDCRPGRRRCFRSASWRDERVFGLTADHERQAAEGLEARCLHCRRFVVEDFGPGVAGWGDVEGFVVLHCGGGGEDWRGEPRSAQEHVNHTATAFSSPIVPRFERKP